MKNPLKTYQFYVKFIGAALLLTLGIWLLADEASAKFIVLLFTGFVAIIFALVRFIPLMRTLKSGKSKAVNAVEILLDIVLAVYLILAAFSLRSDSQSSFSRFNDQNYRFFIALLLFIRVVSYFACTVLMKEETDRTKFFVHILLMSITMVLCALNNITSQWIALVIAVIAFLCSFALIGDGGIGYYRYRKKIVLERKKTETIVDAPTDGKEAPTQPNRIPLEDESPQDSVQIQ